MYIEDIICSVCVSPSVKVNPFDLKIFSSFYNQILDGTSFTEKQSFLSVLLLKKYKAQINAALNIDISSYLEIPKFKKAFRVIKSDKKISIVESIKYKKAIRVEFPYNELVIEKIKKEKTTTSQATWDKEEQAWTFLLTESSLVFLNNLSQEFNFTTDEEFDIYVKQVKEIQENLENYVPILSIDDQKPVLKNVSKNVPELIATNLLEAMFEARKKGICVWDDTVEHALNKENIPKWIFNFLKTSPEQSSTFVFDEFNTFDLSYLLRYMSPCLFVIPGGAELEKLKPIYKLLISNGINSDEISVMFRLPSETGSDFNIFVKEYMINNPITKKTKAVIISTKIPKPVLQSNIKFHTVFNLGFGGVHYSIRDFVGKHENLIFLTEKSTQKEFSFGNM